MPEGQSAGVPMTSPREAVIQADLGSMHAEIERLEHQVERLLSKIEPVVLPAEPQPSSQGPEGVVGPMTSEISRVVRELRGRIVRVTENIIGVTERVEL